MLDLRKAYGNLQGEIYVICKDLFIPCFLEVQTKKNGRPDIVIVIEGKKIIIECKKRWDKNGPKSSTYQMRLYYQLKVPIVMVTEQDNLLHVILTIYDSRIEHGIYVFKNNVLEKRNSDFF